MNDRMTNYKVVPATPKAVQLGGLPHGFYILSNESPIALGFTKGIAHEIMFALAEQDKRGWPAKLP